MSIHSLASIQLQIFFPFFVRVYSETVHKNCRAVYDINSLWPLECWGRGFEFYSRNWLVCSFIHCCLVMWRPLTGSPDQGVLRTIYRLKKLKTRPKPLKRTLEPLITPWPESVSELYRPSDRHLLVKLVPTFSDRGCHVVSVTDPYGRILGFLVRSRYFSFQVAPQLYWRGWV
jgi:hypothetical protein